GDAGDGAAPAAEDEGGAGLDIAYREGQAAEEIAAVEALRFQSDLVIHHWKLGGLLINGAGDAFACADDHISVLEFHRAAAAAVDGLPLLERFAVENRDCFGGIGGEAEKACKEDEGGRKNGFHKEKGPEGMVA